jgi:apolipoprotein N-acyltransferase
VPLVIAPWFCLAPYLLALERGKALRHGFFFGLAFWLASVYWIAPTLETYGQLSAWLAGALMFLACSYLAVYSVLFSWFALRFWRLGGPLALLGIPAVWVAVEWVRTYLFSGFPWNLAAYAGVDIPGVLALSGIVGAYGVSYLLVLANTGFALAWHGKSWRLAVWVGGWCLVALVLGGRWSAYQGSAARSAESLSVRVVQPNIENMVKYDPVQAAENYSKLQRLSLEACDEESAFIVWPESAAWPFSYERDPGLRLDIERLTNRGCNVMLNATVEEEGRYYNAALLVTPSGAVHRYRKRHLVPFGEYVPLKTLLPFIERLARNAGDYSSGGEPSLLPANGQQIGAAICYEITFPAEVAQQVRAGATVLTTITNDAWYGDTSAPWQHFRAARFRAAESRRPVIRAAITGVSGIISPAGEVQDRLGVGEEGVLRAEVYGRTDVSIFSRFPWAVPLVCLVFSSLALLISRRR